MRNRAFAGNVLKLTAGATVAQALGVVLSPVFTRLYGPEAYGTAALFASILGLISVVVCLRYEFAIMLPPKAEDALNVYALSQLIVVIWTVVTVIGVLFLGKPAAKMFKAPGLGPFLWLLPPAVFVSGSWLALRSWNARSKHFGMLSAMQVATAGTTAAMKLTAGLSGYVGRDTSALAV